MTAPLPSGRFGALLADPPWHFEAWSRNGHDRHPSQRLRQVRSVVREEIGVAALMLKPTKQCDRLVAGVLDSLNNLEALLEVADQ